MKFSYFQMGFILDMILFFYILYFVGYFINIIYVNIFKVFKIFYLINKKINKLKLENEFKFFFQFFLVNLDCKFYRLIYIY